MENIIVFLNVESVDTRRTAVQSTIYQKLTSYLRLSWGNFSQLDEAIKFVLKSISR